MSKDASLKLTCEFRLKKKRKLTELEEKNSKNCKSFKYHGFVPPVHLISIFLYIFINNLYRPAFFRFHTISKNRRVVGHLSKSSIQSAKFAFISVNINFYTY